jgi:hypothetical protein
MKPRLQGVLTHWKSSFLASETWTRASVPAPAGRALAGVRYGREEPVPDATVELYEPGWQEVRNARDV